MVCRLKLTRPIHPVARFQGGETPGDGSGHSHTKGMDRKRGRKGKGAEEKGGEGKEGQKIDKFPHRHLLP